MKHFVCVKAVLCVLFSVQIFAQTQPPRTENLRIRVMTVNPPSEVDIKPGSQVKIRRCLGCAWVEVAKPVRIKVSGNKVNLNEDVLNHVELTGSYQIEAAAKRTLFLNWAAIIRADSGKLYMTVEIPLEDYVVAVLAGESSVFHSEEALKAMAVVARTYAVKFRRRHSAQDFDFCDTTHCQRADFGSNVKRYREAAAATEGELLWYNGNLAATYYSRSCGGMTEDGRYMDSTLRAPYLRQQPDSYCVRSGRDDWQSEIAAADLSRALKAGGLATPANLRGIDIIKRTPSGRVQQARLVGDTEVLIEAEQFRLTVGRALGWERIRSDLYQVEKHGDDFLFYGHGQGHRVGLCQWGADAQGQEGKSYREILSFYYPGTAVGLTAQELTWHALSGQRVQMLSTVPDEDKAVLDVADRYLDQLESATGWHFSGKPVLKIYPTVSSFRDSTGEPGWVAASTKGNTIRLQPPAVLRSHDALESTLRHELLHLLVEQQARPGLPLWFREGIVLYLSKVPAEESSKYQMSVVQTEKVLQHPDSQPELRAAYAAAHNRVAELANSYGRDSVLSWVRSGIPETIKDSQQVRQAQPVK